MKRKNTIAAIVVLLSASVAGAQMTGGMPGSGMPQFGNGRVMGGMTGLDMSMGAGMMSLPVAEDGTVFISRSTRTTNATQYELSAVRPSGVVAWTYKLENAGMASAKIAGPNLILAAHPFGTGTTATLTGSVVAVSIASGNQLWKRDLDGFAMSIEPYSDGIYVVVIKPNSTRRSPGAGNNGLPGMNGARTLVAIGNDGAIKWSMPLDN